MHLISAMCSVVKVGRISQQFKKRLAFIDGVLIYLFLGGVILKRCTMWGFLIISRMIQI